MTCQMPARKLCFGAVVILAFAGAPAAVAQVTEVSYLRGSDDPGGHIGKTADLSFIRRAEAPAQWQGDATFGLDSARPGALSTDPDGRLIGRVGLGGGLTLRVAATRGGATAKYRPGIGLSYQLYGAPDGPLSIAAAVDYRPEGFSEVKGEVEA